MQNLTKSKRGIITAALTWTARKERPAGVTHATYAAARVLVPHQTGLFQPQPDREAHLEHLAPTPGARWTTIGTGSRKDMERELVKHFQACTNG